MGTGDVAYMDRALSLADRGRGLTSPNPLVGAVVVSPDGVVVGSGYHRRAGEPHAEVHALRAAGPAAGGGTLFSTLEPCCHMGRTGPCVVRIVEAGVARVVVAVEDPHPRVRGGGIRFLQARGLDVTVGVREMEAARLNQPFFVRIRRGRPFVMMKAALTLDGRVAEAAGRRSAITGARAQRESHGLRAEFDAVAVGSETVLVDDPRLTAREVHRERPLARVVFDSRLRTPPSAALVSTLPAGPVIVMTTEAGVAAAPARAAALESAGVKLLVAPHHDLHAALAQLDREGITSILLEGGPRLQASAWRAGLVDRVRLYVAPFGVGPTGVPWLASQTLLLGMLDDLRVRMVGPDMLVDGYVHRAD